MISNSAAIEQSRRGVFGSPVGWFFLLVLLFSLPFWVVGQLTSLPLPLIPGLPLSALQAFCPVLSAAIVVGWTSGRAGVLGLFRRALDYRQAQGRRWFFLAILTMPVVMLVAWASLPITGTSLPTPEFSVVYEIAILPAFFVAAEGEELGWTGFATDRMQASWGVLGTSLLLGIFWAGWHVVPDLQAGRSLSWVLWQFEGTVALRVIMVWLYNGSGKSVFLVAIFHTSINVSEFPFPNYGTLYNPFVPSLILTGLAVIVTLHFVSRGPGPSIK